jgi:Tfp pilus assembly protein PilX
MTKTFLFRRRAPAPQPFARERGISLVVAIVFLLLMAVLALAGLRGSTTNIQIVGNMQARQEAVNTAQALLETVISTGDFANNPTAVKANAQTTVDLNGDGTADVVARLKTEPVCIRARPIPVTELSPTNDEDNKCLASASIANPGIIVSPTPASQNTLCADTEWDLSVEAVDTVTQARANVHQGVTVRTDVVSLDTFCK